LNVLAENLDALKCGGWGVFIAPTTKVAVGEGCCRRAHRTVRCATGHCSVRQPRHPTVGALTCGATRQSGGAPDSHCALSGAPSTSALTSARAVRALWLTVHLLQTTIGAVTVTPLGTPDSPVNYSGVASQILEGGKFEVDLPGAPDTVWWHTGQSLPSVVFCSFYLNPFLDFLLVCVEPLAPVELII
jgi:hypothetical protein